MGIPHLTACLRPFASPITWFPDDASSSTNQQESDEVIIDGPALAYHIYYQWKQVHLDAVSSREPYPGYDDLGGFTLRWLEKLESHGLRVNNIFFDGVLPSEKEPTRFYRLQTYLKQLSGFKSRNKEVQVSWIYSNAAPRSVQETLILGDSTTTPPNISFIQKGLPAPPFLVPSVLEALLDSKYGERTQVVPGEADDYCVAHSTKLAYIILTSDSDLLVKQPQEQLTSARVMFFSDVSFSADETRRALNGLEYVPSLIGDRLKLDIRKLAYFMQEDSVLSFNEQIRLARRGPVTMEQEVQFQQFVKSHTKNIATHPEHPLDRNLSRLDPRISELVVQFSERLREDLGNPEADRTFEPVKFFLPSLVEDPSRASAWRASWRLRLIAYSFMRSAAPHAPHAPQIAEVDRRGSRITSTFVYDLDPKTLGFASLNLGSVLMLPEESRSNAQIWRSRALFWTLRALSEDRKDLPPWSVVRHLLRGQPERMAWNSIHLHAQVQATLYSLRIVRQVFDVYFDMFESQKRCPDESLGLYVLHEALKKMPPLWKLHGRLTDVLHLGGIRDRVEENLQALYAAREMDSHPSDTLSPTLEEQPSKFESMMAGDQAAVLKEFLKIYCAPNAE